MSQKRSEVYPMRKHPQKTSFGPQNPPVLCAYFAEFIVSINVVTTVFYKRMQA